MKTYVGKEPCPHCGSKDNVGVWSDGQKWCFGGCGYFVPGDTGLSLSDIKERLEQQQEKERNDPNASVNLPADYSLVLREDAEQWVTKYGITSQERFRFKIGWSEVYESLILPAYNIYGHLLVCQRRYFGQGKFPKYHTKGYPERSLWTVRPLAAESRADPFDTYNGTLIVVEDFISAVKIGRRAEAAPLWGSHLSMEKLRQISERWESLVIWLDYNKKEEAIKTRIRALALFTNVSCIITEKDPKEYDDTEIVSLIAGAESRTDGFGGNGVVSHT